MQEISFLCGLWTDFLFKIGSFNLARARAISASSDRTFDGLDNIRDWKQKLLDPVFKLSGLIRSFTGSSHTSIIFFCGRFSNTFILDSAHVRQVHSVTLPVV